MDERQFYRPRDDGRMFESLLFAERPPLDPKRTALVVVDMVNHQLRRGEMALADMEASGVDVGYYVERVDDTVVPNLARLIEACRATGARVTYLRIGAYGVDYADAVPPLREKLRRWGARDGEPACEVDERLKPQPGDINLVKTGSGGFTTSGLDAHLRNAGVEHVLYSGVFTNGCVLLTLAAGFDLGYMGYLVSDATATLSDHIQTSTEEIVSGFMAEVVSTDTVIDRLQQARSS